MDGKRWRVRMHGGINGTGEHWGVCENLVQWELSGIYVCDLVMTPSNVGYSV